MISAESISKTWFNAVIGGAVHVSITLLLKNSQSFNIFQSAILASPVGIGIFIGSYIIINGISEETGGGFRPLGIGSEEKLTNTEKAMSEVNVSIGNELSSKGSTERKDEGVDEGLSPELIDILQQLGISDASSELRDSNYEPYTCLQNASEKLYFLGIMGSKWVSQEHVKAEFKQAINRMEMNDGNIRFLLINPDERGFRKLKRLREGAISKEPLNEYKEMAAESDVLEVRLYNHLPSLRLVFIDNQRLILSRYRFEREKYLETEYGWDIPHLEIRQQAPWSLYQPLNLYYEQIWRSSANIGDVI